MTDATERLRRWRLILGGDEADGTGATLGATDARMDDALSALYDTERQAGLGGSAPRVARWLGDIREHFPTSVVQVLQKDALERLHLRQMLLEPEMLEAIEPDVHLVSDLVALKSLIPAKAKDTARQVVRRVVDDLMKRLANRTRQAVMGTLNRAMRNPRPRHREIDWNRTIRANLKHYQPSHRTPVPRSHERRAVGTRSRAVGRAERGGDGILR